MPARIGVTWGTAVSEEQWPKLERYASSLLAAGAEPVAVMPAGWGRLAREALARRGTGFAAVLEDAGPDACDGWVLAGGPDVAPRHYGEDVSSDTVKVDGPRDDLELPLARAILREGRPVLGVCRGFQLLNIACGGALIQDLPSQMEGVVEHREGVFHELRVAEGSRLAAWCAGEVLAVNSWHHQGTAEARGLASGLRAVAWTRDGLVEAFEDGGGVSSGFLYGVQWHPERPDEADSAVARAVSSALFTALVTAARA